MVDMSDLTLIISQKKPNIPRIAKPYANNIRPNDLITLVSLA